MSRGPGGMSKGPTVERPALMPPEERRALVNAPFARSRVLGHSSAWGGVYIRDSVPVAGHRVWEARPEDEEWCRTKWEEK